MSQTGIMSNQYRMSLVSTSRANASPKKGQDQVSGGVSVPCRHATPVADALWKPIFSNNVEFGKKSKSGKGVINWCTV